MKRVNMARWGVLKGVPHITMNAITPPIPPTPRSFHRRMLVKRWYSLSGTESVRAAIIADESLDESTREELLKIADRRVSDIIDARLREPFEQS